MTRECWIPIRVIAVVCVLLATSAVARAQQVDTSFNPGTNRPVYAIAVQTDGKILVGGDITLLGGGGSGTTPRNYLGRLNADGSLDTSFNPGVSGGDGYSEPEVFALVVQADGKILVGGNFTGLGGGTGTTPRNYLGRMNADGSLDTSFNPGANGRVKTVAVQADGKILVGGNFTGLGGGTGTTPRNNLGRLNANGSLDTSFDPGANGGVFALAVQRDAKILVGGYFTALGGGGTGTTTRNYLGRLNANGSLDTSFDPGANGFVKALAVQAANGEWKILVGGGFTALGGGGTGTTTRNRLGRLNANGTLDIVFDPGTDGVVYAMAVQPDGKILVGGSFYHLGGGGTGTTTRNSIGRLNANGTLDIVFDPGTDSSVYAMAVQADEKILVGGSFLKLGGVNFGSTVRHNIGRLNASPTITETFDTGSQSWRAGSFPDGGPYDQVTGAWILGWGPDVGNPGGAIYMNDPGAGNFFFEAPAGYLGDKSSYYGGQLSYNLKSTGGTPYDEVDVILLGGGLVLVYDSPTHASSAWTTFTIPLSESGWKVGTLAGSAATRAQFQGALASITALRIRGEFGIGADTGYLDNVSLSAGVAPLVTRQPWNQTVTTGATAEFTAAATGTPTPMVQWQVSTNTGSTWSDISGATDTTYAFTAALANSGTQYHAVFTNDVGAETTSPATLTVNPPAVAPSVTTHPSNQAVAAGSTVSFSAAASGTPAPAVRWQVSTNSGSTWSDISGTTSTTYAFTTGLADSGKQYHAVFTNIAGTATSNAATLIVYGAVNVQLVDITFRVTAPPETEDGDVVFMRTGMIFGADEQEHALTKSGSIWAVTLSVPKGLILRYRYSPNQDWSRQESYRYSRGSFQYRQLAVTEAMTVTETIGEWQNAPPAVERTGTLTGTVTNAGDGKPVIDAVVSSGPYQTRTGYAGQYRIKGMPSGLNPVSVYLDDGSFRAQNASVTIPATGSTTRDFQLTAATMRRVTFSASAPATTPESAAPQLLGDKEILGLLPFYNSAMLDVIRFTSLSPLAGRWTYATSLGEGTTIQYIYTLGEQRSNLERDASGNVTVRYATVGTSDLALADDPVSWKRPNDVPVTLNVVAPTSDTVCVTYDSTGFTEAVKMWPLGGGRWTYTAFAAPNTTFRYRYLRSGDGREKLTPDSDDSVRSIVVGTSPLTRDDGILRWRYQLQETLPATIALKSNVPILPRVNGTPFMSGIEFMDFWRTEWKPLIDDSGSFVTSMNAGWAMVSPVWGITSADPPLIEQGWNSFPRQDLIDHIRTLKAKGLNVALFPTAWPSTGPYAGFERHNTAAWYDEFFAELLNCLAVHAQIAEAEDVDLFLLPSINWYDSIDPHQDPASIATINQKMRSIVATLRTIYHGRLSSEYLIFRPEYDWYGDLDYVGDKWWYPIATTSSDSVAQMTAQALSILDTNYLPVYTRFKKPILLAEVAYYSADTSALQHFGVYSPEISAFGPETSTPSAWQQQADAFEAVYSAFAQRPWVQGAFVFGNWYYDLDAKDYSVRGKTARHVLSLLFHNFDVAAKLPAITLYPTNQTVTVGGTASFSAAATGDPLPTVQWQVSTNSGSTWSDISGATSTTYAFTTSLADSGKQYHAVFTNSAGTATSNTVTLTVNAVPSVTTHPSNQSVAAGATASFTAAASGTPTPTVQWQVSTNSGSTWSDVSGATSTTYAFTTALADSGKQFHAVFTNVAGTSTSNAATLLVGIFTDDPLQAGTTPIRAIHIAELRARINAVRATYGLAAFAWTAATMAAGQPIHATDIAELRTALNQAYITAGRTPPIYTDALLVPGQSAMKAVHIDELRRAVIALE